MARARAEEMTLFNFSFVDILATTIGVIVFIMVMVLINVTDRVSADEIVEQFEEIQAQLAKHLAAVDDSAKKLAEDEAARRKHEQDVTAAKGQIQKLKKQLGYERIKKQTLLSAEQQERRKAATLKATKQGLEGRAAYLAGQIAERKKKPREEVPFRVPRERSTRKVPCHLECVQGRVYLLTFAGRLDKRNYTETAVRNVKFLTRKAQALGETIEQARRPDSRFMGMLRRARPGTHFPYFVVREDSFELFRELRAIVWKQGYDYYWQSIPKHTKLHMSVGAGSVLKTL